MVESCKIAFLGALPIHCSNFIESIFESRLEVLRDAIVINHLAKLTGSYTNYLESSKRDIAEMLS